MNRTGVSDKEDQKNYCDYANMEDEEIIARARSGCTRGMEYLIEKYKPLVRAKARSYFLVGADREDIVQEGMIGLFKAVRDYNDEKSIPFRAFADMCVTRQIISAVKTATRQKHIPLNSSISLSRKMFNDESCKELSEVIEEVSVANPEELVISKEEVNVIENRIMALLSPFEQQVLSKYLVGIAYQAIAKQLKKPVKSIDNALQRLKRKIEKCLKAMKEEY